jgi:hypothetical protein
MCLLSILNLRKDLSQYFNSENNKNGYGAKCHFQQYFSYIMVGK